jgi:hypothetical protein
MTTVTAIAERDIEFTSGTLTLAGTFAALAETGPAPAVLLLPGYGQTDRDDNAKKLALNVFPSWPTPSESAASRPCATTSAASVPARATTGTPASMTG